MKNCKAIFFSEKSRTSTIEFLWNNENFGMGGYFSTSIKNKLNKDSFFFIIGYKDTSISFMAVGRFMNRPSSRTGDLSACLAGSVNPVVRHC
jgi:hypothetical protein